MCGHHENAECERTNVGFVCMKSWKYEAQDARDRRKASGMLRRLERGKQEVESGAKLQPRSVDA